MSSNFFNVGNTLEALNNAKNQVAEQNFQNALEDIQDNANEKLTLYGDIEKGSGTLLGGIAGTKAVVSGFKKFKSKLEDFKNRGKSLEERAEDGLDNNADEAEEGLDGITDNLTETAENLTDNLTQNLSSITDNIGQVGQRVLSQVGNSAENIVSNASQTLQSGLNDATSTLQNGMDGIVDSGRNMLNNLVKTGTTDAQPQEVEMSNIGNRDVEMNELGGRTEALPDEEPALRQNMFHERLNYDTNRTQGRLGERTGAEREIPEEEQMAEDQPDKEDFPDLPDDDEFPDDPASEFGGTQPEGIADITTDTSFGVPAIDTAGEVGAEVGAEVADTAISSALDATGIGAIIGIPLQILGLVGAGAGVLTGIFGSDSASSAETKATQQAQSAEAKAKALPADVAGKFAPQIQSQAQRIAGGY